MNDEVDFNTLSLDDRIHHKVWKARQNGYEELSKEFQKASPKDEIFRLHFDNMRSAPSESNVAALDSALTALLSFVENSDLALKLRPQILSTLIEKGLGATKASIKSKTISVLLEFAAIDSIDPLISELSTFVTHKQPKLISASINAITEIVKNFGVNATSSKQILKILPQVFQHADQGVRSEGTTLIVELARWISMGVSLCFDNLKPVQVKEIQDLIAKLPKEQPKPLRRKRSEQEPAPIQIQQFSHSMDVDISNSIQSSELVDAYSLSEPVNVLDKIPQNFYELIESTKWKDRKEALDALLPILKVQKIQDGQFGSLIGVLVKKISDVNVLVVTVASQCLEALGNGLRKCLVPHKSEIIPALLERCKEKNKAVIEALRAALNSLIYSVNNASELGDSYANFLKHKNPQIKAETLAWFERALPTVFKANNSKKEIKIFLDSVLPCMDDSSLEVRDATSSAIATLIRVGGEKQVMPFLDSLDKVKMSKVTEFLTKGNHPETLKSESALGVKNPPLEVVEPKALIIETHKVQITTTSTIEVTDTNSNVKPSIVPSDPINSGRKTIENLSYLRNEDEAWSIFVDVISDNVAQGLLDSNWKVRLTTMEKICTQFESAIPESIDSECLVRAFSQRPSWKESNFQVLSKVIGLLMLFGERRPFSHEAAYLMINGLLDKIGDVKLGTGIALLLTLATENVGLNFVVSALEENIKLQKNPKTIAETFNWLSTTILDFGIAGLDVKKIAEFSKFGIRNSNVVIRTASIRVAVSLRRFLGPETSLLFKDLPAAQISVIDAEFAKVSTDAVPTITKFVKTAKIAKDQNTSATLGGNPSGPPPSGAINLDDAFPRPDVTNSLEILIAELNDPSWKIRKEAMDKATDLISNKNSSRIKLSNGDFLLELKKRFVDSNKNLIIQALDLSSLIAFSMGSPFEKHIRLLLPNAVMCLGDNKPQVRVAVLKFLTSAISVSSLAPMASAFATSLATESPNLRRELLGWLSENLSTINRCSEDDRNGLVQAVISCLLDRTIEVRKSAAAFIDSSLDFLPGDLILRLAQNRTDILTNLRQIIDSHQVKVPSINQLSIASVPEPVMGVLPRTPSKPRTPKKGRLAEPIDDNHVFVCFDPQAKCSRLDSETREVFKWSFDTPRAEFCEYLKGQMTGNIASNIVRLLFSDDFKDVLQGVSLIDETLVKKQENEGVYSNSDLILKYLTIRLFDTNTLILVKTFDLIEHLLGAIDEANLRLSDVEATCFIPIFASRSGEMKDPLKGRLNGIYRQLCRVYPASKIFSFLLDGLKSSKSPKSRIEALREMAVLISRNGLMIIQAGRQIPIIGSFISDRDPQVRNAALRVLVQLHGLLGETLLKHLAHLPQKDLDVFNESLQGTIESDNDDKVAAENCEPELENGAPPINPDQVEAPTAPTASTAPQLFYLDPNMIGTPIKNQTSVTISRTPINNTEYTAPTPSIEANNPFFAQSYDALDRIIQNISSSTDLECIAALQHLDEYMNDLVALSAKIAPLVNSLCIRLHECTHSLETIDPSLKSRLCRYVTNALVLIATNNRLISHLEVSSLTILIQETLVSLVSDRVGDLEDRDQLIRALNVLLVKTLENASRNHCYRSLLHLLEQAFRTPPSETDKYPEYVMKCLWKVTKQLSRNVQAGEIDVGVLLADVHQFFCVLSPMEWKTRAAQKLPLEDLPLRTVKTILLELATELRDRIIPFVRGLENAQQSFVTTYVRAMLSSNNIDSSGLDFDQYPPTPSALKTTNIDIQTTLSSEQLEETLKDICSKICSKPNTRMGISELYELQKSHPHASKFIDSYLEKLGSFFYKYIKRNIAHLEAEINSSGQWSGEAPIESYKNKLAHIQQKVFGVDSSGYGGSGGGMVSGDNLAYKSEESLYNSPVRNRLDSPLSKTINNTPSKLHQGHKTVDGTPTKDSTIISLKERLARLRQSVDQ